ncbi:MAG: HAD hydrolase family protein [Oscillospiraceae bacterium]|nr:HAD hydrolase family protein [Oscillospiraceae bacterium]
MPPHIECIALDLDRTTLDGQGHLSPGNRAALEAVIAQGVEVVVASGRSFASLPEDVLTFPGLRYAITSNGAAVYEIATRQAVHRRVMTPESVAAIWSVVQEEMPAQSVFIDGVAYAPVWYLDHLAEYGVTGWGAQYVSSICRRVEDWPGFIRDNAGRLDSYDVFQHQPEHRAKLFGALCALPKLYFTSSAPHMLEISHPDTGKGNGLRWLMDELGLDPAACAAFGDGENDVDLLRAVGYPVAVENAADSCKAAARYITLAHDRDGVAYALKHYLCLT